MDETVQIPELGDAQYCTEVMHLPVDKTELQHDRELLRKAHGLGIMATLPTVLEANRITSSAMSDSTESTSRDQTFSTVSDGSTIAYLTPHSSIYGVPSPNLSSIDNSIQQKSLGRSLNFSSYEKYLAQVDIVHEEPRFTKSAVQNASSGQSIFSVSTRKSLSGVTSGFRSRMKLRKRPARIFETPVSCFRCHAPFSQSGTLHSLPCGHANCTHCLNDLATRAIQDESNMPPSCCARPVTAEALQQALDIDTQELFLKAVFQYSIPSESRIFCCNSLCREFIPPLKKTDPCMPSAVTCLKCQTKVCSTCKHNAHAIGTHCPEDWELLDALKIGGDGSWRRCYRCRRLVELADATELATCECKAQFCHTCGGVWDITTGCANACRGEEEELAKRRKEEERQATESEAVLATEQEESMERSMAHPSIQAVLESQGKELQRMLGFRVTAESSLKARQAAEEIALENKQVEEEESMKEKHTKATSQLEDRQIREELDLRTSLDQAARSIKVRIKHMEAYCDGLGQNPNGSSDPPRVVTEQNLRDLGHQYNLRDDLERQNEAKINMMRDRQSKSMEELVDKHEVELECLIEGHLREKGELSERLSREQETFQNAFDARQSRCTARWTLAIEIQCKELHEQDGLRYAVVASPSWPENTSTTGDSA
ncbi:hypothetical protein QQS21_002777 [Conoideocrella luteorostrata]|uniref:RING-type domain-containing protein n=1 Tax=Conoideocrella luteorostrata TaxID=1105319 RepID=A0AAJ0CUG7_9HYPO|nr:hypothetical protein QQS21_002777 [Conoideocrella luteorostrata]